jgi:CheY-like chemotaxis protein
MLTTSAVARDVQAAYLHGANSYIVKPVDLDKFSGIASQIQLYWTSQNRLPE